MDRLVRVLMTEPVLLGRALRAALFAFFGVREEPKGAVVVALNVQRRAKRDAD